MAVIEAVIEHRTGVGFIFQGAECRTAFSLRANLSLMRLPRLSESPMLLIRSTAPNILVHMSSEKMDKRWEAVRNTNATTGQPRLRRDPCVVPLASYRIEHERQWARSTGTCFRVGEMSDTV